MVRRISRALIVCFAALMLPAAESPAQSAPVSVPPVADAPVPIDHWVYDLLDRMAGTGVAAERWLPGRRPASAVMIIDVLDAVARSDDQTWSSTAAGAREWIRAEYGAGGVRVDPVVRLSAVDRPDADRRVAGVGVVAVWTPRPGLAVFADPMVEYGTDGAGLTLDRAGVAWRVRGVQVTASRDRLRLGRGAQGGLLLGGEASLMGISVARSAPGRPGGWLRWLGPVDGSLGLSWIGGNDLGPAAVLATGEARMRPHPRVVVALRRATVVAASDDGIPVSLGAVGRELIGRYTRFGDTKLAVGVSVRASIADTEMVPYLEWAVEDLSGLQDDPGIVLGLRLPALDVAGLPVGVRYEYVGIGESGRLWRRFVCCYEFRDWYRNDGARPVYVNEGGELLGHPLGGYGHQHLVDLEVALPARGLIVRGGAVYRQREGGELVRPQNLLFAHYPGRSGAAFLDISAQRSAARFSLGLVAEDGDGWSRLEGRFQVTLWSDLN